MCAGNFTGPCTHEDEKDSCHHQVALAGNNGIIYILENYKVNVRSMITLRTQIETSILLQITSFVQVDYSITCLLRYRPKSLPKSSPDILFCAGHCNEIRAYYYGEVCFGVYTD
jgi:hypothetical protein